MGRRHPTRPARVRKLHGERKLTCASSAQRGLRAKVGVVHRRGEGMGQRSACYSAVSGRPKPPYALTRSDISFNPNFAGRKRQFCGDIHGTPVVELRQPASIT